MKETGFSQEWDSIYQQGKHLSVWPWTKLVSLVSRYTKLDKTSRVLELGCGAGANIPFFTAMGVDYFAVEGSQSMVNKLNDHYGERENVHIAQGDFTKDFHWTGTFDLIVDRGAVTHNETKDIVNVLTMVHDRLNTNGYFIGIDWHSPKQTAMNQGEYEEIDANTRVFSTGYYADLGKVHFSDEIHLRKLLDQFNIVELDEAVDYIKYPEPSVGAGWNFVVEK